MNTATPKNPKIKAGLLKAGTDREHTDDEARESRMQKRMKQTFTRTTDLIARDGFLVKNQPVPKGKELFPAEWKMQYVDLFYPYALDKNGERMPLYIDMPSTVHDVAICERKLKVMRDAKLRYTYLKPGEAEWEGTLRLEGQDPDKIKADQARLRAEEVTA